MPQQRLYKEYVNGKLVPYWYVLTLQPGEMNWNDDYFFFEPIAPFEYIERCEFDESIISTSIYMRDFIRRPSSPHLLGLNLIRMKERIQLLGIDPFLVRQFIVCSEDLNEVLQLLPNERTKSFMLVR
jgi:hypothetical protein